VWRTLPAPDPFLVGLAQNQSRRSSQADGFFVALSDYRHY